MTGHYNISETITMYSDDGCQCSVDGINQDGDYFASNLNTFLEKGWKLLHIGQETSHGPNGALWYRTVAVFGK